MLTTLVNRFYREKKYTLDDEKSAPRKLTDTTPCQFIELTEGEMNALNAATKRGEMWAVSGTKESMSDISPEYFARMAARFRARNETMTASWIEAVALHIATLNARIDEKCEKINDIQDLLTRALKQISNLETQKEDEAYEFTV